MKYALDLQFMRLHSFSHRLKQRCQRLTCHAIQQGAFRIVAGNAGKAAMKSCRISE